VRIGAGVNQLAALHFLQDLQLPSHAIPYLKSMTFYAPKAVPFVTIGLYYERSADSRSVRDILTSSAFGLQQIQSLDTQFAYDANLIEMVQPRDMTNGQLDWFTQNRQRIVDSMRNCAEGTMLSKTYDCDFTTRRRPPENTPAALVVTHGNPAGVQVDYTVIAQQIVFAP
jgi:hypothetical protein